jgi:diguanylate cyclase (GGDEF)-like protein
MDILLSLLGLIILSPLFLLIAVAIKRSSPGPIFYWGSRVGKNGKLFKILKFRTMYERKESYAGPKVTAEDDKRITPLGRTLRQTKANELPQLWNVIIGDMSLVGPRPEDPTIAAKWPEEVRREILKVKPGITSPASVVYRNEEDQLQSSNLMDTYLWDILPSKLRLDQIYVRSRSVLTDLDVLFWTLVALLPSLGRFSVPEHLLYWGPLSRFMYRYLGWFLVDFLVSFIAVAAAGTLRRLTTPLDLGLGVATLIALAIALLFSLINALSGLNRIYWSRARTQDALDLAFSSGVVTAVVLVANMVFPRGTRFPISVIITSGVLSYFGFIAVRYRGRLLAGIAKYWMRLRGNAITSLGERVLIVGAGEVARFTIWLLSNENMAQAFSIIGMVDDNPRKIGTKQDGYQVIGTTNSIPELVKKFDIGLILFAIADIQPTEQDRILSLCQATSARITPIPDIIDSLRAHFPKNETEREVHFNKVLRNATIDRLTGAYNRAHFFHLAEIEFNRAQRYNHSLSLIALDMDYVRPGNASYSKAVTSQVMQTAAQHCLGNIRGVDLLGRLNEKILVVLLPETDEGAARFVAQRIKRFITGGQLETSRGPIQPIVEMNVATAKQGELTDVETLVNLVLEPFINVQRPSETIAINHSDFK